MLALGYLDANNHTVINWSDFNIIISENSKMKVREMPLTGKPDDLNSTTRNQMGEENSLPSPSCPLTSTGIP